MKQVSGDTPERPLDPPEEFPEEKNKEDYCQECNAHLPHMGQVDYCTEHLDGQELIDYAANLKECFDKVVGENRELAKSRSEISDMLVRSGEREEEYRIICQTLINMNNKILADSLGITKEGE